MQSSHSSLDESLLCIFQGRYWITQDPTWHQSSFESLLACEARGRLPGIVLVIARTLLIPWSPSLGCKSPGFPQWVCRLGEKHKTHPQIGTENNIISVLNRYGADYPSPIIAVTVTICGTRSDDRDSPWPNWWGSSAPSSWPGLSLAHENCRLSAPATSSSPHTRTCEQTRV